MLPLHDVHWFQGAEGKGPLVMVVARCTLHVALPRGRNRKFAPLIRDCDRPVPMIVKQIPRAGSSLEATFDEPHGRVI